MAERNNEETRGFRRRRQCRFCTEKDVTLDYKDTSLLRMYVSERGKIIPRRISGNCAKHQRAGAVAVGRARILALLPFASIGV